MKFWMTMTAYSMLIPVLILLSGILMCRFCVGKKNALLGYRTPRSTVSQEAWMFANDFCGRLYQKMGWITMAVTPLIMIPVIKAPDKTVETAGGIAMIAQMIALLIPIFMTESALRKNFHKNGIKKEKTF